ncbi:(2Fe-2S)-binding protein [Virgibacillus sp. Bac330]|uniref:(2Fe-2S)-binding protein n=1 Tax=Virgibacillus sp. Bac330 TaxID=2419841 RepID=UPI000EF47A55|nr:(2Fe-2S)-binding protein [Virgibacillus sp. Bac330]
MQLEKHPITGRKAGKEIQFLFNGELLKAKEGQTVAAALMANGIKEFGKSRKLLQSRGLYCATGRCTNCFVTINGLEHSISCTTVLEDGMKVESNNADPTRRELNEN